MKIKVSQLRSMIREALEHASHESLKALAAAAIADLEAGGTPEDVYAWLAAETDLGNGRHRAPAVAKLVKAKDMWHGSRLERVARDNPMPPEPYRAPYSGASGKMYETDSE